MRDCEENSRCVQSKESRDWISRLASRQSGTRVEHAEELKGHNSWNITGQKFQSGQAISLRLVLVARLSRQNALFG